MPAFGLLNLNKPPGVTSRDVVNHVQRLVKPAKAGHAGTLDPLASGVLIVCTGQATRLIDYVHAMPKRYRATFLLGRTSPTEDIEGDVTIVSGDVEPSEAQIREAAACLIGPIEQRPPAYSALKVAGRRSYQLARAGQDVQHPSRTVLIHQLEVVSYHYPQLVLDVECGSGTYVRSLGRDLAEQVGTVAVMSALTRTAIGHFDLSASFDPMTLTMDNIDDRLLPATEAVRNLPQIELRDDEVRRIVHGLPIAGASPVDAAEVAAVDQSGKLVAILAGKLEGQLAPTRVLHAS